jgi:CBS-domain-containing membrane protein
MTPLLYSESELYRPSDRRLLEKLVPTFADKGCHAVSVMDPYGRIVGLDICMSNIYLIMFSNASLAWRQSCVLWEMSQCSP